MVKTIRTILSIFLVLSLLFIFADGISAANITFSADTEVDFTSASPTVYINSGSECDSLYLATSTLHADVSATDTFTLETATYTVLGLTPAGTTTLVFDTANYSTGYVTQWTASSSLATATSSFSVGVASASTDYLIYVDSSFYKEDTSDANGKVEFDYLTPLSSTAKTFSIIVEPSSSDGGGVSAADIVAPTISQIEVVESDTQATISWKTNESSISWMVYGTSADYGLEEKTTSYILSHSLTLTGLSPETTYHYQIKARDNSGNTRLSADQTFTTLVEGEVAEEETEITKPISEMTIEELQAEIVRITNLISQLQVQLIGSGEYVEIPSDFTFNKVLKYGETSDEVKYLQIILKKEIGTPTYPDSVSATGWFGPITKNSVIEFQEKYTSEILSPWGITEGTGFIGETTRAKLNMLLGK